MSYLRHDKDNVEKETQPLSNTVTLYDGDEGWDTITYEVWNGDYVARKVDNTTRTPASYQRHDKDNEPISSGSYQRHDVNNNPVEI
jgi:superfamily I DNA and RNA helicase